jgi:uncharacterized integral membrane protein (TIGR00698 family)
MGLAASAVASHYAAPITLIALFMGMVLHFLSADSRCAAGIHFSSSVLMRVGVALLAVRISPAEFQSMGWLPVGMAMGAVIGSLLAGVLLARVFGFSTQLGVLTGGAVGICGVSAALALYTILPDLRDKPRSLLVVVVSITTMSTAAMIAYPMVAGELGLSAFETGLFLGVTIHDVAQAVSAGYAVSPEVGAVSTVTKLARVTLLIPVMYAIALLIRSRAEQAVTSGRQALPWFLVGFLALFGLNTFLTIPPLVQEGLTGLSSALMIMAISALGMKTSVAQALEVGIKPFAFVGLLTLLLAINALAVLLLLR